MKNNILRGIFPLIRIILAFVLGWVVTAVYYSGYGERCWSWTKEKAQKSGVLSVRDVSKVKESRPSVFADKLSPIYEDPVRVYAKDPQNPERFIFDAVLVEVGVDDSGQLEAPENWDEAGWYRGSAKTGEEGNIIINGHYDDNYARPAAFYNLKRLKVNDKVYLVDSFGRGYSYQVTQVYYVGINDEDRVQKVLESEGASLTLITCGGVWAPSEGTYDNRLVVKAHRVS